ncbi:hypothetical protein LSAT2_014013 [Lamellibrachia satsuma]|nr:hypothetical protein LSAT2_014013 [Lamellibrachia satsuma]
MVALRPGPGVLALLLLLPCSGISQASASGECPGGAVSNGPDLIEWQDDANGSSVTVEWGYGNETCSSVADCFGINGTVDVPLEPQMLPVQIQQGVLLSSCDGYGLQLALLNVEVTS